MAKREKGIAKEMYYEYGHWVGGKHCPSCGKFIAKDKDFCSDKCAIRDGITVEVEGKWTWLDSEAVTKLQQEAKKDAGFDGEG